MNIQAPYTRKLYSAITISGGGTQTAITDFPMLEDCTFIVDVTVTGGSENYNLNLETAYDWQAATPAAYYTFARFTAVTATIVRRMLVFPLPVGGSAGVGTDATKYEQVLGTSTTAFGGFAHITSNIRLNAVLASGTGSTTTITVWVAGNPRQRTV